jgi:hypothetical protein
MQFMKTPTEQIKELEAMIAQAKDPNGVLVLNWRRNIQILKLNINEKNNLLLPMS